MPQVDRKPMSAFLHCHGLSRRRFRHFEISLPQKGSRRIRMTLGNFVYPLTVGEGRAVGFDISHRRSQKAAPPSWDISQINATP